MLDTTDFSTNTKSIYFPFCYPVCKNSIVFQLVFLYQVPYANVLFGDGKHRGLGRVLLVVFKLISLPRLVYIVVESMAISYKLGQSLTP